MTPETYLDIRRQVIDAGYCDEIQWQQTVKSPSTSEEFAWEAIWVILCSGMKEQVARKIQKKVETAINAGVSIDTVFGHKGKARAIASIWNRRKPLFEAFLSAPDKVEVCRSLLWIGNTTKYHLAKNLGVDTAKPDVHLVRVAEHFDTTPENLCSRISSGTGDRVATVDLVIWRACNLGIIDSKNIQLS